MLCFCLFVFGVAGFRLSGDLLAGPPLQCFSLQLAPASVITTAPAFASPAMTAEQAAQLIDSTLDQVHQRLQDLQAQSLPAEQRALAAEFREWRHPNGGHIDLMVFPGLAG